MRRWGPPTFGTTCGHHVTFTRNQPTGLLQVYVDGQLENSFTDGTGVAGGNITEMGRNVGVGNGFVVGDLDEIRLVDDVLSSNWVWAVWLNGASNDVFNCYDAQAGGGGGGDVIVNVAESGVTSTSAVLNATLNASGAVYTVYAYWNTVDGGTNPVTWVNEELIGVFTNEPSTNLNLLVTNLSANTSYFFTFRASNCRRTMCGPLRP